MCRLVMLNLRRRKKVSFHSTQAERSGEHQVHRPSCFVMLNASKAHTATREQMWRCMVMWPAARWRMELSPLLLGQTAPSFPPQTQIEGMSTAVRQWRS